MEDTKNVGNLTLGGNCALYICSHMPIDLQYHRMLRFIGKVTAPFTSGNLRVERNAPLKIARVYTESLSTTKGDNYATPMAALQDDYAHGLFTHVLIDMPACESGHTDQHHITQGLEQKGIPYINIYDEAVRNATAEQTGRPYPQYTDALTYAADAIAYMPALCDEILQFLRRQYHILYQTNTGDKKRQNYYAHYSETLRLINEDLAKNKAHGEITYVETALHEYYKDRKRNERLFNTAPGENLLIDEPRLTEDIATKNFMPKDMLEIMQTIEQFRQLGFGAHLVNDNAYKIAKPYTIKETPYEVYLDPRERDYVTFTAVKNNVISIRFKVHGDWKWTTQDLDNLITFVIEKADTQNYVTDGQFEEEAEEITRSLKKPAKRKTATKAKPGKKNRYREDESKDPGCFTIENIYSLESIYEALYKAVKKALPQLVRLQSYHVDEEALFRAIKDELEAERESALWGSSPYCIKKYYYDPIPVIESFRFKDEIADRIENITSILRPYGLRPRMETFIPPDVHNISPLTDQDTAYAISVRPYRNIIEDAQRRDDETNTPFSMYTEAAPPPGRYATCFIRLRIAEGRQPLQKADIVTHIRKILDNIENSNLHRDDFQIEDVKLEDKDNNGEPLQ